jgi:murein DD-endopeptidase MepM/ murein hydrolase activator NlpD
MLQRPWLTATFLAFGFLVFKPCFKIPHVAIKPFPLELPQQVPPGEVILVDTAALQITKPVRLPFFPALPIAVKIDHLAINKRQLSTWQQNVYMGSVGVPSLIDRSSRSKKAPYPAVALVGEHLISGGHAFQPPKKIIYIHEFEVTLETPDKAVSIRLPAAVQQRLKQDQSLLDAERTRMREVLAGRENRHPMTFTASCWQKPMASVVVSQFASPRTLPDGRQYYHTGLDQRAAVGTKVYATAPGEVVYSGFMTVPGNTVVVHHGSEIYSRYIHLDKILVQPGELIKRGQVLGLSGATGRVEAPHLHWEVVWKGIPVSPQRFLAAVEPTCDQG